METTPQTLTPDRSAIPTYRGTARAVGLIYIAGMVIGMTGNIVVLSVLSAPDHLATLPASSMLLAIAALFWLLTGAGDAAHGILMFPVLKRHSERMAVGYLGFRIMDATFIAVMVLLVLMQIPIGAAYLQAGASDQTYLETLSAVLFQAHLDAYNIAMLTLGISGLLICWVLYRMRLIPRPLAVWGLIGYAIILGGSALEILGVDLMSFHAYPGGLWEVVIGVWLIVKGFNPLPAPTNTSTGSASTTQPPAGPGR